LELLRVISRKHIVAVLAIEAAHRPLVQSIHSTANPHSHLQPVDLVEPTPWPHRSYWLQKTGAHPKGVYLRIVTERTNTFETSSNIGIAAPACCMRQSVLILYPLLLTAAACPLDKCPYHFEKKLNITN
jgi:hypothetical protein